MGKPHVQLINPEFQRETRGPSDPGSCTHLRMTVYKGKGKHSSSQSPAMNFDRSAVSLRLYMDYVDKINTM